ncbi:MAG: translational machinery protein [Devosia sp.]
MTYHAAVWIDHQQAKVFHLTAQDVEKDALHNGAPAHHIHRKADHVGLGKTQLETAFMKDVAEALTGAQAILLAGPGQARTELLSFLQASYPAIAANVWDNQAMDHPTDGQIVAAARTYFAGADRMHREPTH